MSALLTHMPADVPTFVVDFLSRPKYPGVVPSADTPERRQYAAAMLNPLVVPVLSRIMATQPNDVAGFISDGILQQAELLAETKQEEQQGGRRRAAGAGAGAAGGGGKLLLKAGGGSGGSGVSSSIVGPRARTPARGGRNP